ncbi:hypothetical protein pEaSNUABM5_00158 [Erwinia phage pEa_SNUABM_5]|uniref:Uncharacterized protein n=1 Tax=Erwinia phage pEa_SNUABM_5 TaxID=2797313 RepID=A0A7T8IVN4_9CAUD|nr:hypothetical protein MPK73_gp158 [Erwinia phage pEa_SNUABM_5]QQO90300.1 hypothetical protein pEaSNUABM5_00158 [Erwinia phage pEa_SNUABM_5]
MFIEKTGFVSNQSMWKSILTDLTTNGFDLISANGALATTVPSTKLDSFVIKPKVAVDPLFDVQPWRIAVKCYPVSTRMYAGAPEQISDLGDIARVGQVPFSSSALKPNYAGAIGSRFMAQNNAIPQDADGNDINEVCFWHRGVDSAQGVNATAYAGTMSFSSDTAVGGTVNQTNGESLIRSDAAATPFTYSLAISDHGIALHIRIEGQDDAGCRHAWVVIQRAINSDGTIVKTGKAPLFCMFSVNGGGSPTNDRPLNLAASTLSGLNTNLAYSIQRFTVRESDVNAPTPPVNAAVHSADAFAVINPLQQVAFSENNQFDFRLPQGFNTQRFSYPYEMDMVGYASADVISNGTTIETQVYGETANGQPKLRKYKALSANSPKNTGMRLFMLTEGGGV